jgi:hypothetical protein
LVEIGVAASPANWRTAHGMWSEAIDQSNGHRPPG